MESSVIRLVGQHQIKVWTPREGLVLVGDAHIERKTANEDMEIISITFPLQDDL